MCVVLSTVVSVENCFLVATSVFWFAFFLSFFFLLLLQILYCMKWQNEIEIPCQSSKFPIEFQLLKLNVRYKSY